MTPAEGDDEMSVIFDNKIFGSNFGSGTLAVTVLGYRNGNFEETDTVSNSAISWDSYREISHLRFLIFTASRSTNLGIPSDLIIRIRPSPSRS